MKMNMFQLNENNNMNETNEYWNTVYELKWSNNSNIYGKEANNIVASYCLQYLTLDETIKLHNFVVNKRKELSEFLMGYLKGISKEQKDLMRLSDDGFWDLCSHIVGMGEVVYYLVKKYPHMIFDLQNDIQENFEYGFDKAIYEMNNIQEFK